MVTRPTFRLLGDPHLGRRFVHGVPLARQGVREEMVWNQFVAELEPMGADIHVCMGDLFDRAHVPYEVILQAGWSYKMVAQRNRETEFVILKGNHDWQRDLERAAAFDLFEALLLHQPNIHVVSTSLLLAGYGFFAWHPTRLTEEMWLDGIGDTVFGHWDVEKFGNNVIPYDFLREKGVKRVYTGHVHQADGFMQRGLEIIQTGSMQPYAHGEERDESLYLTRTLETFDPDENYRAKCLRIVLGPGEVFDREVDCLQLTIKRQGEVEDTMMPDVTLGEFDMEKLFRQAFLETGVDERFLEKTLSAFNEKRAIG